MRDRVVLLEDIEDISKYGAERLYELSNSLEKVRVAFSGGDTPKLLLKKLAEMDINWKKVEIFAVDERFVSPKSIKSNYRLLEKNLIENIKIPNENIHWIEFGGDIEEKALDYEIKIRKAFNLKDRELPRFDMIFLGLGEDGRIGSLFPKSFNPKSKKLISVYKDSKNKENNRITMNINVINNSKNVCFLISGECKAEVFEKAYKKEDIDTPLYYLKLTNGMLYYIIDKAVMKR